MRMKSAHAAPGAGDRSLPRRLARVIAGSCMNASTGARASLQNRLIFTDPFPGARFFHAIPSRAVRGGAEGKEGVKDLLRAAATRRRDERPALRTGSPPRKVSHTMRRYPSLDVACILVAAIALPPDSPTGPQPSRSRASPIQEPALRDPWKHDSEGDITTESATATPTTSRRRPDDGQEAGGKLHRLHRHAFRPGDRSGGCVERDGPRVRNARAPRAPRSGDARLIAEHPAGSAMPHHAPPWMGGGLKP